MDYTQSEEDWWNSQDFDTFRYNYQYVYVVSLIVVAKGNTTGTFNTMTSSGWIKKSINFFISIFS